MNYNWSLYSPYIKNIISQKKKIVKPGEILSIFTIFFKMAKTRSYICMFDVFYENLKRFKFTWKSSLPWKCVILGLRLFFLFS